MKVEKLEIEELDFNKRLLSSKYKEVVSIAKSYKIDLKTLLPSLPQYTVSLTINDVPVSFPNAIRRCLIDYIPVSILHFDMYNDFDCTDPYLTCDYFNLVLGSIHIDQDQKWQGSIDVYNPSTTDLLEISTHDIKFKNGKIHSNYPICVLRPKTSLKIKNIYALEIRGCDNGRAKICNGVVIYRTPDQKPYDQFTDSGDRSTVYDPRRFIVGYRTRATKDNKYIPLIKALDTIVVSCESVKESVEKNDSRKVIITSSFDVFTYSFFGEYFTIVDLIRDYILEVNPSVGRVSSINKSFDEDVGMLLIQHPDHRDLILHACEAILKEVNIVRKAIK